MLYRVGIGEMVISSVDEDVLMAPSLGSCVGLALYDNVDCRADQHRRRQIKEFVQYREQRRQHHRTAMRARIPEQTPQRVRFLLSYLPINGHMIIVTSFPYSR